jgi:phosphoribosyl-ATP pyrophosphohydrolase
VYEGYMSDSLGRLFEQVAAAKDADPAVSRTAKLLRAGRSKMAKKLAEEAIEVVIDAMNGDREAVVRESADLLYNLVVVWSEAGVRPQEVWDEMARRERLFGLAEKVPKKVQGKIQENAGRRKVVMLASRRSPKRR